MLKNLKITILPLLCLLISGCGLSTTPYATSNHTIYKKVAHQAEPIQEIHASNPVTIKTEVVDVPSAVKKEVDSPIPGTAMTSLKNRAFLVGGNALAILKLYEDHDAFAAATSNMNVDINESHLTANNVSGLVANIYQCI